jgi:hypothetical protein
MGQQATSAISNIFGQQGQAGAGRALAQGQAFDNIAGQIPAAVKYFQQAPSINVRSGPASPGAFGGVSYSRIPGGGSIGYGE